MAWSVLLSSKQSSVAYLLEKCMRPCLDMLDLKELLFNADGEAVKRVACVDWFLFTGKRTELVLFI